MPASTSSNAIAKRAEEESRNIATKASEKGLELRSKAERQTREIVDHAADNVGHMSSRVGDGFEKAAEKIRDNAPENGRVGQMFCNVADKMDQAGGYIRSTDLRSFSHDCVNLVRRHPVQSALAGLGVGILLAKIGRWGGNRWIK